MVTLGAVGERRNIGQIGWSNGNEDLWGLLVTRAYLGSYKVLLREGYGCVTQQDGRGHQECRSAQPGHEH